MLNATIENLSPLARTHWPVLTLPTDLVGDLPHESTFRGSAGQLFRMVYARTAGEKTVYRVLATLGGGQKLTGTVEPIPHADQSPFRSHPWVLDDLQAAVPNYGVVLDSGEVLMSGATYAAPIAFGESAAHRRFVIIRRIPEHGLYFVTFADVLSNDAVIPFWSKLIWSHRSDPRPSRTFRGFVMECGEFSSLDFAKRHGIQPPEFDPVRQVWRRHLTSGPVSLQDGAGLAVSGRILAYRSGMDLHASPEASPDLQNLRAAQYGPVLAMSHDWNGHFLANENIARFDPSYVSLREEEWQQFLTDQEEEAGWFAARELGSGRLPGATGQQEDFGATKGTYAVVEHDPRFIYRLQYSVQAELFRGWNLFEDNGNFLQARNHPLWVTWSGETHYSLSISPDRLGKLPTPFEIGTGFKPPDDQHRSHNDLAAYLMCTDDPLMEDQLRHIAEVDMAAYRVRYPMNGVDAARAQGRTLQAMAQMLSVVDEPTGRQLRRAFDVRLVPIVGNPLLFVPGPMKVLAFGEPDQRKHVYLADGVTFAPWASMWEHGLAAVGLYTAWKLSQSVLLLQALRTVCATLAEFGCFEHNSEWHTTDDIIWRGGEPPEGGMVPGREIVSNVGMGISVPFKDSGTGSWTFAGILVAREVLGMEHPLRPKLDRYVSALTQGREAVDRITAEWWAAVR